MVILPVCLRGFRGFIKCDADCNNYYYFDRMELIYRLLIREKRIYSAIFLLGPIIPVCLIH